MYEQADLQLKHEYMVKTLLMHLIITKIVVFLTVLIIFCILRETQKFALSMGLI